MAVANSTLLECIPDLPQLQQMDKLLRCGICYEFLKTSVITSCSHNYCSRCIREHLDYQANCPTCFTNTTDSDLRPNRTLDNVVLYFPAIRDALIKFAKQLSTKSNNFIFNCDTVSSSCQPDGICKSDPRPSFTNDIPVLKVNSPQTPSKSLLSQQPSVSCDEIVCLRTPLKEQSQTAPINAVLTPRKCSLLKTGAGLLATLDGGPPSPARNTNVLDYFSPKKVSNLASKPARHISGSQFSVNVNSGCSTNGSSIKKKKDITAQEPLLCRNTVSCPVCNMQVPSLQINHHLDTCADQGTKPPPKPLKAPQKRHPMSKLVYYLLSDKEIKEKLKQVNLSIVGSKNVLIKRHQRYVSLYNSECDKVNPRAVQELVRQVEREELGAAGASNLSKQPPSIFKYDSKSAPEIIEKEQQKIAKKYNKQFSSLLADLKRRQGKSNEKLISPGSSITTEKNNHPAAADKEIVINDSDEDCLDCDGLAFCSQTSISNKNGENACRASFKLMSSGSSKNSLSTPRRSKLSLQRSAEKCGAAAGCQDPKCDETSHDNERAASKRSLQFGDCDVLDDRGVFSRHTATAGDVVAERGEEVSKNISQAPKCLTVVDDPDQSLDNLFEGYEDDHLMTFDEISNKEEEIASTCIKSNVQPFVPYKTTQPAPKQSPNVYSSGSTSELVPDHHEFISADKSASSKIAVDTDSEISSTQVFEYSDDKTATEKCHSFSDELIKTQGDATPAVITLSEVRASPDVFKCSDEDISSESDCSFSLLDDRASQLQELGFADEPKVVLVSKNCNTNILKGDKTEEDDEELIPASQKRNKKSVLLAHRDLLGLHVTTLVQVRALSCDTGPSDNELHSKESDAGDCDKLRVYRSPERKNHNCIDSQQLITDSSETFDSGDFCLVRPPSRRKDNCIESSDPEDPAKSGNVTPELIFENKSPKITTRNGRQLNVHNKLLRSRQLNPLTSITEQNILPVPKRNLRHRSNNSTSSSALIANSDTNSEGSSSDASSGEKHNVITTLLPRSSRRSVAEKRTSDRTLLAAAHAETLNTVCGPETMELLDGTESDPDFRPSTQEMMELSDSSLDTTAVVSRAGRKKRRRESLEEERGEMAAGQRRSTRRRR